MAIDERVRSELFRAAAAAFGEEPAVTMFALLPPPDTELATRADIDELARRLDMVDGRLAALEQRFGGFEQRFGGLVERSYLDARLDGLRDEMIAAFRGELVTAVAGQSRAVIVATATAVFGIGGLAVALAQLF